MADALSSYHAEIVQLIGNDEERYLAFLDWVEAKWPELGTKRV